MKLTKLLLTASAALGFSALQASAAIGVTVNYDNLSVSITVTTNKASTTSGDVTRTTTGTTAIGNKQLLDLFAVWDDADRTTDPWKSARLVVAWDEPWNGDDVVVDKTGTNVLFDATTGVSGADFYVDFFDEDGAYTETDNDNEPGGDSWHELYAADWYLNDDFVSGNYISLSGDGGNVDNFAQNWAHDEFTTWSDSENAVFPFQGDQSLNDSSTETSSAKATFTASGHGKGENPYLY